MATLIVSLDDSLLGTLLAKSQEQRQGLDAYIGGVLEAAVNGPALTARRPPDEQGVLERALQRALALPSGTEFGLEAVCDTSDWEAMTGGAKELWEAFSEVRGKPRPRYWSIRWSNEWQRSHLFAYLKSAVLARWHGLRSIISYRSVLAIATRLTVSATRATPRHRIRRPTQTMRSIGDADYG